MQTERAGKERADRGDLQRSIEALRSDIIFGRLRPHERLVESELMERLSTSRHVVRAALDELDRLGLVHRRPNRGVVVCDYSTTEVEELYEVRALLQREAVQRLPLPAPRALLAELETANADYLRQIEQGRPDLVVRANDLFHRTLFGACGNRFLAEAIETYWARTAAIHSYAIASPSLAHGSHRQHAAMIAALRRGDRNDLLHLVTAHMVPALDAYKDAHGGWSELGEPAAASSHKGETHDYRPHREGRGRPED